LTILPFSLFWDCSQSHIDHDQRLLLNPYALNLTESGSFIPLKKCQIDLEINAYIKLEQKNLYSQGIHTPSLLMALLIAGCSGIRSGL
jgi:hypothetical protein